MKKKSPEKSPGISDLPCHEDLFTCLKEMRLKLARASNLPPFVIFHDRTLRAISRQLPQTTSDLLTIKGCGEYKVSAYGSQTIEVVRTYLKGHPEARPLSGPAGFVVIRPVLKKTSGGSTVEITWGLWRGGTPKTLPQRGALHRQRLLNILFSSLTKVGPSILTELFQRRESP